MRKQSFIPCEIRQLPVNFHVAAVKTAIETNPANGPSVGMLARLSSLALVDEATQPQFIAVLTTKYWGAKGVKLGVSFTEPTPADLRDRILSHMNAWGQWCNVQFAWSQSCGQVRISRGPGGYWSYLGTDILHVPSSQQTMNLQGFTMSTSESEYKRVVRHETGHSLGFPHEHMRPQEVARLDPAKTIAYFLQTQGWSAEMTKQQVLTPLDEASLRGSPNADEDSIMCYQLPGSITKDGRPIAGGTDIDAVDREYAGKLYPLEVTPPPQQLTITLNQDVKAGTYRIVT